jgi:hypothetical protein
VLTGVKDIYQQVFSARILLLESKMKKLNMAQKAKKAGLPAQTVYNRMHNGWSEKKALSVPNGNYKKKTVAYKVEPKKVQASGSRVKKPIIPLPIEKFEEPKNDNGMYIAIGLVALALMLVVAIAQN